MDLTTNPIVLDTTGATSAITNALIISAIVWDSGASGAAGNTVLLNVSSGGAVVFAATLATAKDTLIFCPARPFRVDGLYLTTLSNGTVYVYLA